MKRILVRSKDNQRCEINDEVKCILLLTISKDSLNIRYGPNNVFNYITSGLERLEINKIGKNAWTLLKSMKKAEHSICEVKDEEFRRNEDPVMLN